MMPCRLVLALAFVGVFALLGGCPSKRDRADPTTSPAVPPKAPAATSKPATPARGKPAVQRIRDVGFQTPESVRYDSVEDVYLVSNINGDPFAKDGNGFISKVSPAGKVLALKWIDGATKGVVLNAPKGMALTKDALYVADIDHVRVFERRTGKPRRSVAVPGATFLNDVVATAGGRIYVSDSGLKPGFAPSGSDAIWELTAAGKAERVVAGADLGRPNGLTVDGDDLVVVTFGSGELYRLGKDRKIKGRVKAPKGSLDGVERLADGSLLVSSWAASAVYRVTASGAFTLLFDQLPAPADIGVDTKRSRLLVPLFNASQLVTVPLGP